MKKVGLRRIILLLTLALLIPNTSAQDYIEWSLPTGAKMRIGKGDVNDIIFSPDGTRLAVAGSIGIWIYDVFTGKELDMYTGHTDPVYSVSFSPDSKTLASGSEDDTIRLWDAVTGTHLKILIGHTESANSINFSPDGSTLASGGWDHTIRLWNAITGDHLKTLTGHTHDVESLSFSPDGKTLGSGSSDGTILLWDMPSVE